MIQPPAKVITDTAGLKILATMKNLIRRICLGLEYMIAIHKLNNLRSDSNNINSDNLIKLWMVKGKKPMCYFYVHRHKMAQFQEFLYLFKDKDTNIGITPVYVQSVEDDLFDGYKKYLELKYKSKTSKS